MILTFTRATEADIPRLRALAETIWREFYPAIIGHAQVEYMLAEMYSEDTIRAELASKVIWELAKLAEVPVGFLSVTLKEDGRAKLNRLYLEVAHHGRGHGQALIERACAIAYEGGSRDIWLQVNKDNTPARRAYERAGFRLECEAVFDIGGGFVMDDYVLVRDLR